MGRKQASYSLHDYVKNNNNSFDQSGFNNADGAVLTQLSNMNFDGAGIDINSGNSISILELYIKVKNTEQYKSMSADNQKLLEEMANSERYKNMIVSNYVHDPVKNGVNGFSSVGKNADSEQFAAVTISYKQNGKTTNYMSFRATDSTDDGWNEDFLMISSKKTQAQSDSVAYMNIVGRKLDGDFSGGGHSKGGNDFEYGYLFCDDEVRSKITAGYMYDSPGLQSEIVENNPYYKELQRISKGHFVCPQDSIVGQLLHENENATYVQSVETGFNEHDPYSWEIDSETGEFIQTEQSEMSKYINSLLDKSVENMDDKERNALFSLVSFIIYNDGSNAEGLDSFKAYFVRKDGKLNIEKLKELYDYIKNLPPEQRKKLMEAVGAILGGLIVTTYNYVAQQIEKWVGDMKKRIKNAIDSAIDKVKKWVDKTINTVNNFFHDIYNSFVKTINGFKNWWNKNFNVGYKYANENPYIVINTNTMNSYATQLANLSQRAKALDGRMNSLYWHAGFDWNVARAISNLGTLLKAEVVLDFAYRLDKNVSYLRVTAQEFENVEREIAGMC